MSQEHHHHHHPSSLLSGHGHASSPAGAGVLLLSILLNVAYAAGEFWAGVLWNSSGLKADAGHNLGDVGSLALALLAVRLHALPPRGRFTYGLKRGTILAAMANGLLLLGAAALILWECLERFRTPLPIPGGKVSLTAAAGLLVNGATAWLLAARRKQDLNFRGAFLHMLADALVSLGVVLSGTLVALTGWTILDPLAGIAVALLIAASSWNLFQESLCLLLDAAPRDLNPREIQQAMAAIPGVQAVNTLHLRALSTTENQLVANITATPNVNPKDLKLQIRNALHALNLQDIHLQIDP